MKQGMEVLERVKKYIYPIISVMSTPLKTCID